MRNFDRFRSPSQDYHASVLALLLVRASIVIGLLLTDEHRLWLTSFIDRSSLIAEHALQQLRNERTFFIPRIE